jgi:hypothetical protein
MVSILFLIFSIPNFSSQSNNINLLQIQDKPFKGCNTLLFSNSVANKDSLMNSIDVLLFENGLEIDEFDRGRNLIKTKFSNHFDDKGSLVYCSFVFRVVGERLYLSGEYYSSAFPESRETIVLSGWAVPKLAFNRMDFIGKKIANDISYLKR